MTDPTLLDLIRRLAATAQTGLSHTTGKFDRLRYEEVGRIAAALARFGESDVAEMAQVFGRDDGYITPKLIVRAAVFSAGRVLMVRELSDGLWTLPGGWIDVGESPAAAAEREVWEEAGLRVTAYKLAAVFDKHRHDHPPAPHHAYLLFFLCRLIEDPPPPTSAAGGDGLETDQFGWFSAEALPPVSPGRATAGQILRMFEHRSHPDLPTDFD